MNQATDRRIAVAGLGYVGLPLALSFREAGLDVVGIDTNPNRVEELSGRQLAHRRHRRRAPRPEPRGGLRVTGPEGSGLDTVDVVFVCVPTPITRSKTRTSGRSCAPPA